MNLVISWAVKLGLSAWPFILKYLEANALQAVFDLIDEGVETALENAEKKAKASPEKSDDRRIAVMRKYFEGWKKLKA